MSWRDSAIPVSDAPSPQASSWRQSAIPVNPPIAAKPEMDFSPGNIIKQAGGAAAGVAEVMNPLAIPHALANVVIASANYPVDAAKIYKDNPKESFFGAISKSLNMAEERNPIPKLDVTQLAAGARTYLDIVPAVATGNIPSPQEVKSIYSEEMKSQEKFNKEVGTSKMIGEGAGALASLGLLAKDIATFGGGLEAKLGEAAENQAYKSIQPMGKKNLVITQQEREASIGRQLLDDGIVGPVASKGTMLERTQDKLAEYGEKIGDFAKKADQAVASSKDLRGVSVDQFANDTLEKVVSPLLKDPSTKDAGNQVFNWLDQLKETTGGADLSFEQAQNIKTNLGKMKAKFQYTGDSITADSFRDVYRILNDKIETGIGSALDASGSTKNYDEFIKAKDSYRNLSDAEAFLESAVARNNKNHSLGLLDREGGIMGSIIGSTPIEKGVGAVAGTLLSKAGRSKGNQAAASFLETVQELLSNKFTQVSPDKIPEVIGAINSLNLVQDKKAKP